MTPRARAVHHHAQTLLELLLAPLGNAYTQALREGLTKAGLPG